MKPKLYPHKLIYISVFDSIIKGRVITQLPLIYLAPGRVLNSYHNNPWFRNLLNTYISTLQAK